MHQNKTVELLKQRLHLKQQLKGVEESLVGRGIEDMDFEQRIENLQKLIVHFEDQDGITIHGGGVEVAVYKPRFVGVLQEELDDAKNMLAAVEEGEKKG